MGPVRAGGKTVERHHHLENDFAIGHVDRDLPTDRNSSPLGKCMGSSTPSGVAPASDGPRHSTGGRRRRPSHPGSDAVVDCSVIAPTRQLRPAVTFGLPTRRANDGRFPAMSTITTGDGVEIYYKDWGSGQPIVFSHGWPLS